MEFMLVTDVRRYQWIGFEEEQQEPTQEQREVGTRQEETGKEEEEEVVAKIRQRNKASSSLPTPPESPILKAVASQPSSSSTPNSKLVQSKTNKAFDSVSRHDTTFYTALKDSIHLITSFRGIGYAFGPKLSSLPQPIYHKNDRKKFLSRSVKRLIRSHFISNFCVVLMVHKDDLIPRFLQHHLPLSITISQMIANVLSYLSVGVSLHAQMLVGFEGCKLLLGLPSLLLTEKWTMWEFDEREWPDLFWEPFWPRNVSSFWSKHWHHLFRDPFTSVGYEPISKLGTRLFGGNNKDVGRALGVITVFSLSSWLHDQALYSARYKLPPLSNLSFLERYGGWLFFLSQSLAVIIEATVSSLQQHPQQKRKLQGIKWRIWSYFWIVGVGCLAGRSWLAMGLVQGIPPVYDWSWQRFFIPTLSLAPSPLFVVKQ